MILRISQNAQESACEFCEISKNTFFYRTPPVATSEIIEVYISNDAAYKPNKNYANDRGKTL